MRHIWCVVKHDMGVILRQRSFWFLAMIMPLFLIALQTYTVIQDNDLALTGSDSQSEEEADAISNESLLIGLVDQAEIINIIPSGFPTEQFIFFESETAAQGALKADEIMQYALIPTNYVDTGQIVVYDKLFQIRQDNQQMGLAFGNQGYALTTLINVNLTGDEQLSTLIQNPVPAALATTHILQPTQTNRDAQRSVGLLLASILPYLFYFLLVMGGSYLMRAVVAEKENRTVEILLSSIQPHNLMLGKLLAMSGVLLVQLLIWIGGGWFILNRRVELLNLGSYEFSPMLIMWTVLFLIFGYLLFGSIMAMAGALAPNAREGGQMIWLLIIPLMPTLIFGQLFFEEPNGTLPLFLSFFPLSAPSAMVTRIAVADVPIWQPIVSLLGLIVTTYLFIRLAGRFFRSGNLLSHASFSWRRLITAWR